MFALALGQVFVSVGADFPWSLLSVFIVLVQFAGGFCWASGICLAADAAGTRARWLAWEAAVVEIRGLPRPDIRISRKPDEDTRCRSSR